MNFTIENSLMLLTISTISTMVFVQVFKTILNSILKGKFDAKTLFSDGDFPSSHTAILISFNIVFWYSIYTYHINNPNVDIFGSICAGAVLVLWSFYEIRDAMGVRLRVQEHAYAIKQIALSSKDMSKKFEKLHLEDDAINSKALEEKINDLLINTKLKAGHLPHEVLGGVFTGGLIGSMFVCYSINTPNSHLTLYVIIIILIVYITIAIIMFSQKKNTKKIIDERNIV